MKINLEIPDEKRSGWAICEWNKFSGGGFYRHDYNEIGKI